MEPYKPATKLAHGSWPGLQVPPEEAAHAATLAKRREQRARPAAYEKREVAVRFNDGNWIHYRNIAIAARAIGCGRRSVADRASGVVKSPLVMPDGTSVNVRTVWIQNE